MLRTIWRSVSPSPTGEAGSVHVVKGTRSSSISAGSSSHSGIFLSPMLVLSMSAAYPGMA